jgi:hypothetical protein
MFNPSGSKLAIYNQYQKRGLWSTNPSINTILPFLKYASTLTYTNADPAKTSKWVEVDILPAPIRSGIPKTHDLGFCFFPFRLRSRRALLVFRNCLLGDSLSGLMSAPQTETASPAAKIFLLALISLS